MTLVDSLEQREAEIQVLYVKDLTLLDVNTDGPLFYTDDWTNLMEWETFDDLLNILHIPIKYIRRCVEDNSGITLAIANVNFWLKKHNFSLVINKERDVITQIFDGQRVYVPAVEINDLLVSLIDNCNILAHDTYEGMFHAIYINSKDTILNFERGVRILYSDSFNVTPRFDGILWDRISGAILAWPVQGRKFKTANTTAEQIKTHITQIVVDAIKGLDEVLPWLNSCYYSDEVNTIDFIYRLCAEQRIPIAIRTKLVNELNLDEITLDQFLVKVAKLQLDIETLRKLQVSVTKYLVERNFK